MNHGRRGVLAATIVAAALLSSDANAQGPGRPIIDMHLHALPADFQGPPPQVICAPFTELPAWDPQEPYMAAFARMLDSPACKNPLVGAMDDEALMRDTLAVMEQHNVIGVAGGPTEFVERWHAAAPDRIMRGLLFQMLPNAPSPAAIRELAEDGRLDVLGEVAIQYQGIEPGDPSFEPYLAMAEEIDLPVGIHIGPGPPGAPYIAWPSYRARMHSPLSLEEALLRHPKLRVYVMHAGWPMLDDTLALLFAHPQVYVEVGVISFVLPRSEFHPYLQRLVAAGFSNRVMFGSDQMVWPAAIEVAVESIESAEFLSDEQKRNIFYNNAARFLRLSEEQIAAHHAH